MSFPDDDEPRSQTTKSVFNPLAKFPTPVGDEAFIGLAGEFVNIVGPRVEADPIALLVQFLAAVGCMAGRGLYFEWAAMPYYMNLFALFVGEGGAPGQSCGPAVADIGSNAVSSIQNGGRTAWRRARASSGRYVTPSLNP